jgi:hypothetical protein
LIEYWQLKIKEYKESSSFGATLWNLVSNTPSPEMQTYPELLTSATRESIIRGDIYNDGIIQDKMLLRLKSLKFSP